MSIARHHAEWIALTEIVGPFLSMEVLLEIFPQGLDRHDRQHYRLLKQAYGEWAENPEQWHRPWIDWVLTNTLEYPEDCLLTGQEIPKGVTLHLPEHQITLRPDRLLIDPSNQQPLLLIQQVPPHQKLGGTSKGSPWSASPVTQMIELLRGTNQRLGLLTNGEQWMLLHAPRGRSATEVSWYGHLWVEEKVTVRSLRSLLGIQRFLDVTEAERLPPLFDRSLDSQQDVTDQLGFQVRKAVEILIQTFDRLNHDLGGELLAGRTTQELYEAACFVMMRLVFLLCAEERDLLLKTGVNRACYDQNYAVSTMQEPLRAFADKYGEEILERSADQWCRLLAVFRAVYSGAYHEQLAIPARGGDLFDPDKFPFLEGRFGTRQRPIQVDNRTVLNLLEALQILQIKVPGGGVEPRRLSFKAIEVEQIGHVYEGLLDHQAVRAASTMLGLGGTKHKQPEVALEELERLRGLGEGELLAFLQRETGRSVAALRKLLPQSGQVLREFVELSAYEAGRYLGRCGNDRLLWERIQPFYRLIRFDIYGYPVILPVGTMFVTTGTERRESGTHYTPRVLTEEIVKYTLEPLVYEGVSEGLDRSQWRLRSASELLALKVCDPTMGSGAFLVQVCRYLGDRLLESWGALLAGHPGGLFTVFGEESEPGLGEGLIPEEEEERLLVAKQLIAERCIYGVDKNSMAVEMAKLSLWLETLQRDKPFTFVDHALRCGDSLVGVGLEQLKVWSLAVEGGGYQLGIGGDEVQRLVGEAIAKRRELASFVVVSAADLGRKGLLLREAEARLRDLRDRADLLVASYLAAVKGSEREVLRRYLLIVANGGADLDDLHRQDLPDLAVLRPFHWELEFPEVFLEDSGFDAICGNPPFMGGTKISSALGKAYQEYIKEQIGQIKSGGRSDLCSYFFVKNFSIIKASGCLGLVATNTIAQGDTRELGLDQIAKNGVIYRAVPSRPWLGAAALEVAYVWIKKGQWQGQYFLDDKEVDSITPYLDIAGKSTGNPYALKANSNKSFTGNKVYGDGFVLDSKEAEKLIKKDAKNKDVLFPYLNGADLNSNPDQSPSRWVINFFDRPLSPEHNETKSLNSVSYASDYPDCLEIVEKLVKPERTRLNDKGEFVLRKPLPQQWWIHGDKRRAMYEAIAPLNRVLVIPETTKFFAFVFYKPDIVFSHMVKVFTFNQYKDFAILNSSIHNHWALNYSSTIGSGTRYMPTDCFETFPFPELTPALEAELETIGQQYYQHRQTLMAQNQEGLTKTYNRFHDPTETTPQIEKLRQLHRQMDNTVAKAYHWQDLPLDHNFHPTKQGQRYTISETARREILDRLLQLNHQRHATETQQGHHTKKTKTKPKTPRKNPNQLTLPT